MSIPAVLNQPEQFSGWMSCFHGLMTKPLPLVGPRGARVALAWRWCAVCVVLVWRLRGAACWAGLGLGWLPARPGLQRLHGAAGREQV